MENDKWKMTNNFFTGQINREVLNHRIRPCSSFCLRVFAREALPGID
jgi:hypothetical protein